MRRLSFCLLVCASVVWAQDQEPLPAPRVLDPAVDRVRTDMAFLASDACEGRGLQTKGINAAADYIAARFKELGLKSGPADGSYFQPFRIAGQPKLGTPNRVTVVADGTSTDVKDYTVCGLTGKGTAKGEIVFVGYGITVGDDPKDYDDYRGIDVKGKIVVMLRQHPRVGNVKEPFSSDPLRQASLTDKIATAEKNKAAGIVFVNDRDKAGTTDELMPFDYARGAGGADVPVVQIKRELLERWLTETKTSLKAIEEGIEADLKPRSIALPGRTLELEATIIRNDIMAKNVIAVKEGSGPLKDETVVIGAHYDHLGRGERGSRVKGSTAIHYGADDNASGTTSVLELARRFAERKDYVGRRIVFMCFSGEEQGLLGSVHYCKEPLFPVDKTVAMLNLDMVGRLRDSKLEVGGVGSGKGMEELVDRLNEKFKFELRKTRAGTGPSDHASFYLKGMPVLFFFTGMHSEYHTPDDKPSTLNIPGLVQVVTMTEAAATELATSVTRPEYIKGQTASSSPSSGGGPRIGFMPGEYDDDETRGVPVGGVSAGGAAETGGLKAGDWITAVGDVHVKNMNGYMKAMASKKKGEPIPFTIRRADQTLKLTITP